jgi:ankyrin repeat protein
MCHVVGAGASVDQVNRLGDTALFWACQREGRQDVIALLLNRGADPCVTSKDGRTALMLSAGKGQVGSVGQLLKWRGPQGQRLDANATDRKGRTALWEACANGHGEVARLLLTEGLADPCVAHVDGRTPLAAAQAAQHTDAITLLQVLSKAQQQQRLFAPPLGLGLPCLTVLCSLGCVLVLGVGAELSGAQAAVPGLVPQPLPHLRHTQPPTPQRCPRPPPLPRLAARRVCGRGGGVQSGATGSGGGGPA